MPVAQKNDERPFVKGDKIEYCGDHYLVLENHGSRGMVQEFPNGVVIYPFYWQIHGAKCRRAE